MNNYTRNQEHLGQRAPGTSMPGRPEEDSDSQALKELIEILKEPFQTTCHHCGGEGLLRGGRECPTCLGKGKVLEKLLR